MTNNYEGLNGVVALMFDGYFYPILTVDENWKFSPRNEVNTNFCKN